MIHNTSWPYANETGITEKLNCDVLVLGGGLAGCYAAIAAARRGQSVILVEKGAVERSGSAGTGLIWNHLAARYVIQKMNLRVQLFAMKRQS